MVCKLHKVVWLHLFPPAHGCSVNASWKNNNLFLIASFFAEDFSFLKVTVHPAISFFFFFLISNLPYSLLPPKQLSHMPPMCVESQQLLSWGWMKCRKLEVYQSIPNTIHWLSAVVYASILILGFIFILFWWYNKMYNCFWEFEIAFVEIWGLSHES